MNELGDSRSTIGKRYLHLLSVSQFVCLFVGWLVCLSLSPDVVITRCISKIASTSSHIPCTIPLFIIMVIITNTNTNTILITTRWTPPPNPPPQGHHLDLDRFASEASPLSMQHLASETSCNNVRYHHEAFNPAIVVIIMKLLMRMTIMLITSL